MCAIQINNNYTLYCCTHVNTLVSSRSILQYVHVQIHSKIEMGVITFPSLAEV